MPFPLRRLNSPRFGQIPHSACAHGPASHHPALSNALSLTDPINRIFVEKKAVHNAEARHLLHALHESLVLPCLTGVRIVQRYDIKGLTDDELSSTSCLILSDPEVDSISETLSILENETAFAVEFLPGQFDQPADSAAQCVQILAPPICHAVVDDALLGYPSFYNNVQQAAKRGVAGARTLLDNLARFFPRNRRANVAAVPATVRTPHPATGDFHITYGSRSGYRLNADPKTVEIDPERVFAYPRKMNKGPESVIDDPFPVDEDPERVGDGRKSIAGASFSPA